MMKKITPKYQPGDMLINNKKHRDVTSNFCLLLITKVCKSTSESEDLYQVIVLYNNQTANRHANNNNNTQLFYTWALDNLNCWELVC